jgi:type II secretory pathway component GspD/PulD (secretin)
MKRFLGGIALISLVSAHVFASDPILSQNRFSVNVEDADVSQVLGLVAAQSGLQLKMDKDLGILVTMNESNTTAKEVLDRLTQDQQLEYAVKGGQLVVTKRTIGVPGAQGSVHRFPLRFAASTEVAAKLSPIVPTNEKLIFDEKANAMLFVGSESTWEKISEVIRYLDVAPTQILIETEIVETTNQFLREMGIALNAQSGNGRHTLTTANDAPAAPSLSYSGIFTGVMGSTLDVNITAAETNGDAKVVSRPKVLTLNNQHAKIESGVEIHVKTLSTAISNPTVPSTSVSTGIPGLSATTGVTTLNAGLTLDILPTVVGSDMIKLSVNINNSQPDNSTLVDGIPNIENNAATTSIMVHNGETAVIAGLVKQSKASSKTGVPYLSSIPIIGALFRSSSDSDSKDELVIFITPKIDGNHVDVAEKSVAIPSGNSP